jgi:hypothetical protein
MVRYIIVDERALLDLLDLSRRACELLATEGNQVLADALNGARAEVETPVSILA